MAKSFKSIIASITFLFLLFAPLFTHAQDDDDTPADPVPENVIDAGFQSRCQLAVEMGYPECADSPSECGSKASEIHKIKVANPEATDETPEDQKTKDVPRLNIPFNCRFLVEPIGGRPGYDLYKVVPVDDKQVSYELWSGEPLVGNEQGPFQAILAYEEGKETQGPFGLLYNYLSLIYNYVSALIVAVAILIIIVAGVRISTAQGNSEGVEGGKKMIYGALIGMVLWFTASVILYTINPTFFAF